MTYDVWTTRDGRRVPVVEMTDVHLLHTIRAILDGRLFPRPLLPYANGDERDGMDHGDIGVTVVVCRQAARDVDRENWLTVLKGEALRRGLDWSTPPTRKVGLVEHVLRAIGLRHPDAAVDTAKQYMAAVGLVEPAIDVTTKDNRPTYMHWRPADWPAEPGAPVEKS